jgi:hypothetical protein
MIERGPLHEDLPGEREVKLLPREIVAHEERRLGFRIHDEEAKLKRAEPDDAEREDGERIVSETRRRFAAVKEEAENDLRAIDRGRRPMEERAIKSPEPSPAETELLSAKEDYERKAKELSADISKTVGWTGKSEKFFMDKLETILSELENVHPNLNERSFVRRLAAEDVIWSRLNPSLLYGFFTARRKYRTALAAIGKESHTLLAREFAGIPTADELPDDLELVSK